MSEPTTSLQPPRSARPKVTLVMPRPNFIYDRNSPISIPIQHTPYSLPTAASTAHASNLPPGLLNNQFFQHMHAQRAGDFMSKHFEGLNKFTKSGLSVGEKSVMWIYAKFTKWSRKWFTHIFLFLVVFLYTVAGAFVFRAIEGECRHCVWSAGLEIYIFYMKRNFTAALFYIKKKYSVYISSDQNLIRDTVRRKFVEDIVWKCFKFHPTHSLSAHRECCSCSASSSSHKFTHSVRDSPMKITHMW